MFWILELRKAESVSLDPWTDCAEPSAQLIYSEVAWDSSY